MAFHFVKMGNRKFTKKARKLILDLVIVASIIISILSGYMFYESRKKYEIAKHDYDEIRDIINVKPEDNDKVVVYSPRRYIDWDSLKAIDPNVVAWIELPDSSIDYPVVHGSDNKWYLKHLINGKRNGAGTIFIDFNNSDDFSDKNTALYGHHMFDEPLMFAEIENYKSQSWYDTHKVIQIHTPDSEYDMYPVAGYRTTGTGGYLKFAFTSDEEYLNYIKSFTDRSTFKSEETITANDRMILLSTCSYDVYDGRYVLIGKLVKVDGKYKGDIGQ